MPYFPVHRLFSDFSGYSPGDLNFGFKPDGSENEVWHESGFENFSHIFQGMWVLAAFPVFRHLVSEAEWVKRDEKRIRYG